MVALFCTAGSSPPSVMVPTPGLMVMVLEPPLTLEAMIAWRSEPAPASLPLVTKKSAASAPAGVRQALDSSAMENAIRPRAAASGRSAIPKACIDDSPPRPSDRSPPTGSCREASA
jgi:hypothetical protein